MSKENIEIFRKAVKKVSDQELDELLAAQAELDGDLDEYLEEAKSYKKFLEEEKKKQEAN